MNKKRKNRKKKLILSFVLLIILVGFNGIMIVYGGGEVQDNSAPAVPSGGRPISDCTTGNTAMRDSVRFFGVRVALVDNDGNNLGRISDIWHHDNIYAQKWLWHSKINTYNGNQNLKKDLTGAEVVTGVETATSMWKLLMEVYNGNIFWNTTVETYFPHFYVGIEFTGNDSWGGLQGKIQTMKTKWQQKYDAGEWSEVEETLKKLFQVDSIDYANSFIQFEPLEMLTMWKCNKFDVAKHLIYYGTPSELVNVTKWYGATATSPSPQERFFEKYGTGIRIESGKDHPTPYSETSSASIDFDTFKSSVGTNGYAVSHIWLKDFFNGEDCDTLVEIINENETDYPADSAAYHAAITAVREGDASVDIKDKDGNIHHAVDGETYNDNRENFWMFQDNYTKRTDSRDSKPKKAQCNIREVNCNTAVKNINNYGSHYTPPANIGSQEYKDAIKEISEGKWFYYASTIEGGEEVWDYFLIDQAYPIAIYKGLDPAVYGDSKASCDADTKNCEEALEYIHSNKSIFGNTNTHEYHETIKAVREGTWEYEETDPTTGATKILRIDRAYPEHNLLLEANYGNGEAECDSKDDSIECPGKPPIKNVDPCETGVSQYMDSSDKDNWLKCGIAYVEGETYSSENTGHVATDATSSFENNVVGNKEYCRIFCYEEVTTEFPTQVTGVKAGQVFFWGQLPKDDGIFGTVNITKRCSTREQDHDGESGEGYLFKKWEKDYKENEQKMVENQLKKGAYEEAMKDENITKQSSNKVCAYPLTPTGLCPFNTYNWQCTVKTSSGLVSHDPTSGEEGTWIGSLSASKDATKTGSCTMCTETDACNNATQLLKNELNNEKATFEAAVNEAITEEKKLLEAIEQCTSNLKYEYKTMVYFTFKEPMNAKYDPHERHDWVYNQKFESEPSAEDGYNQDNVDKSSHCTPTTVYTYSCSGSGADADCTASPKEVLDCTQVTWEIIGSWTYKYTNSPQLEWWSLKKGNKLVNTEHKDTAIGDEYYYSLGFGLPTALVLPNGTYGDLKAYVIHLGDNGEITDADETVYKLPEDTHFDPIADSVTVPEIGDTGKGFEYECTYEVENEIFGYDCKYNGGVLSSNSPEYCDPTEDDDPNGELIGIDVAYRLVSLLNPGDDISKAFPGQDGSGIRRKGSNWQDVEGIIPDILRADVYQQDRNGQPNLAMYEIFLDVRTITEIRKENKTLGDKAYGSFDNVECYGDGDKKYCASEFLSKLHNGGYGNQLEGTCLTTSDTAGRAQDVYSSGCNGSYSFNFSWERVN